MRWPTKLLVGLAAGYLLSSLFTEEDSPEAADKRFIKHAITLEAQQVPMYQRLALRARSDGAHHLALGLEKAMEVEQDHLRELQIQAGRLGINQTPWRLLGHGLGMLSGAILARADKSTVLKAVSAIEGMAIRDYDKARHSSDDSQLRRLYLSHQVDEEFHRAWADALRES